MRWMIYGANGYTGRLLAREAARRGLRPVLAGRSREPLQALGRELALEARVFPLEAEALDLGLRDIDLVLHAAGPFSSTSAPMLEACLRARAHYLDLTGEIEVFAHAHRQHQRACEAGIVLLPGAGFDIVPTDGLAALLKQALPDARSLVLAFEAPGGSSPGTARTAFEGLARGGCVRIGGELRRVPLAWKTRSFERDGLQRFAVSIPWGDVYTAHLSTGIPDIEVYLALPPERVRRLRLLRPFAPLLGFSPLSRLAGAMIRARVSGPTAAERAASCCWLWGEARNDSGVMAELRLKTPNGYDLTVTAALALVERLLQSPAQAGYHTPSTLMGADFVLGLPGVERLDP